MRFEFRRSGRIAARATFYGLVVLAFGLLMALSGFVSYFTPIYETCASLWENLLRQLSTPGVLLPVGIIGSFVFMAGLTLIRQWRATWRLLDRLASYRVPVPGRLARIAREVGLEDRIDCVSDVVIAPFCYGFIRPRVCVPVALLALLDDSELRAVLRHEGYHAQSRDPLKVWLSRALARGLYFLPLAGDLRDSYLAAKEVAADEVTACADELPLASALVKLLSTSDGQVQALQPVEVAAGALGRLSIVGLISITREPANETEERIRRLVDGEAVQLRLPSLTSFFLSAMIILAIFAASYANLSAASAMPVSQECVAEPGPEHHRSTPGPDPLSGLGEIVGPAWVGSQGAPLSADWSVSVPGADAASVTEMAALSNKMPRYTCDLLTPSCRQNVLLSVTIDP